MTDDSFQGTDTRSAEQPHTHYTSESLTCKHCCYTGRFHYQQYADMRIVSCPKCETVDEENSCD